MLFSIDETSNLIFLKLFSILCVLELLKRDLIVGRSNGLQFSIGRLFHPYISNRCGNSTLITQK